MARAPDFQKQQRGAGQDPCATRLLELFERNGCVRVPDFKARKRFGRRYKKGWEVRLILNNQQELAESRMLLRRVGLKPGRAFAKRSQLVQPIYGENAVHSFLAWIGTTHDRQAPS